MVERTLADGTMIQIDEVDAPLLDNARWYGHKASGKVYIAARETGGNRELAYLHRLIGGEDAERVIFANGNSLDCRRANLIAAGKRRARRSIDKGAIAEAEVCADLIRFGHEVFLPFSGHAAADLVSLKGASRPIRWQVKYRTAKANTITLILRNVHTNSSGATNKPINLRELDGFAIYCPDYRQVFYVPIAVIAPDAVSFSMSVAANKGRPMARDANQFLSPDDALDTISGTLIQKMVN